jgi:peptidyl-prolyl cis-trans isomerase SurA
MPYRGWLVAGLLLSGAAAGAQTAPQGPPGQSQAGQNPLPPLAPAPSQTKTPPGQTAPGKTTSSSTPVPSSASTQPPVTPIQGTVLEEIVARVNNEIITNVDYQHALADVAQQAQEECKGCSPEQVQAKIAETQKNALRDLIDQSLMVQRAKDLDISVETDLVKQLDEIRQQNNQDNSLPDLEALQKAVEAQGIDWEEFKNNIRNHLLVQKVVEREIQAKMDIDHAAVQKYYDEHKDQFERPEMVYIREILVSAKDKPDSEMPKLRAKAEELRKRVLENGDDFGELAKHFSDGSTAKEGGELGSFKPGELDPTYAAVFKLNRNEMTPVIEVKDAQGHISGFEILQVQERYEAGLQPLDKVEVEIENRLAAEQTEPKVRAYLNTLRQDSFVWIHPGYVDTAGVSSTPIVEEEAPAPDQKQQASTSQSQQKKKKFLKIF